MLTRVARTYIELTLHSMESRSTGALESRVCEEGDRSAFPSVQAWPRVAYVYLTRASRVTTQAVASV